MRRRRGVRGETAREPIPGPSSNTCSYVCRRRASAVRHDGAAEPPADPLLRDHSPVSGPHSSGLPVPVILGVAMVTAGVVYPVTGAALDHTTPITIAAVRAIGGGLLLTLAL